jgi:hypothetical protein
MKTIKSTLVLATLFAMALPAMAQQRKPVSPHETISGTVDGVKVTVSYGRPYTKDPKTGEPRQIWGKLVPYGKVWRTGANEATLLTTDADLMVGDTMVPAGKYSLYTLPTEDGAKLIINTQTGQWGTEYDKEKDLARVEMKKTTLDKPVDQFTMAIEGSDSGKGALKMSWVTTEYSVPLKAHK